MSQLYALGLIRNSNNKISSIFDELFPSIKTLAYSTPSDFIKKCWDIYDQSPHRDNKIINGKMFEYLLAVLLIRENILPFYMQAKVAFIPNVEYDIVLYSKESGPVSISAKTSLRERYKQADLESFVLKNVHRNAKNYLITLNEPEAKNINKKIDGLKLMAIDRCIFAMDEEFDEFITRLKKEDFIPAPSVKTIESSFYIE